MLFHGADAIGCTTFLWHQDSDRETGIMRVLLDQQKKGGQVSGRPFKQLLQKSGAGDEAVR